MAPRTRDDCKIDELRDLQDQLIAAAERMGISDDTRVSVNGPADMTIRALRVYIWARYEPQIRDALRVLTRR